MTDPLLPVISKVLGATLFLGGTAPDYADATDFACDAKAIKVTPSSDKDGDDVTLACGTVLAAPRKKTYTLNGTGIQRFDDPLALQAFCFDHDGETTHFKLRFNDGGSPTYEGNVVIEALEEGGDAGADPGDLSFEFDGVDVYTRVYAAPLAAEAAEEEPAEAAA